MRRSVACTSCSSKIPIFYHIVKYSFFITPIISTLVQLTHYWNLYSEEWNTLNIAFENSMKDTDASVRVAVLKFSESHACALSEIVVADNNQVG